MPSQSTQQIPLFRAHDGVEYRLLELPAEIVELLESDDPPALTLQSSKSAALLRAGERTYSVLQKNTSNDVMLLTPTPAPSEQQTEAPSSSLSQSGMVVFSTLNETYELVREADGAKEPAVKKKSKWAELFDEETRLGMKR